MCKQLKQIKKEYIENLYKISVDSRPEQNL